MATMGSQIDDRALCPMLSRASLRIHGSGEDIATSRLVLGSCHVPFGAQYLGEWLLEFRICVCVTDDGELMWCVLSWTQI